MARTLTQLQQQTLRLLNEAANSPVGQLDSGVDTTPTIGTDQTLTDYLNQAAAELCRSCVALIATGTATLATGQRTVRYGDLSAGGRTLWAARSVAFGGAALIECGVEELGVFNPDFVWAANGTPVYWYEDGEAVLGVDPKPSAGGTLTVVGLSTPAPLVNGSDAVDWIADERAFLLCERAAALIARQNLEDASLAPRADVWDARFAAGKVELYSLLPESVRLYFPPLAVK